MGIDENIWLPLSLQTQALTTPELLVILPR